MKQKKAAKLILFIFLIAAALIIGLRGMFRGWELQRRLACAEQMKRIGAALKMYDDLGGGDLNKLVDLGAIRSEDLICPAGHQRSYSTVSGDGDIALIEPLSNHAEGANLLFSDGHVSFVLRDDYEKLIKERESQKR